MDRAEFAELIIDSLLPDAPHNTVTEAVILTNALWPVLERVYEEGVLSGYDHTNMPECNPYREGYRFEDWHR